MLVCASGAISHGLYLLTLGASTHYLLHKPQLPTTAVLFDCGLSAHVPALCERIEQTGLSLNAVDQLFLTHLHPERVGGLPLLRKRIPNLVVHGTAVMQQKLTTPAFIDELFRADQKLSACYGGLSNLTTLSFDEYKKLLKVDKVFPESENFCFSPELSLRCLAAPGHTLESVAYLVIPAQILIADETFGYFRGKLLAAPGGDWNLEESCETITKFTNLPLSFLCFPNTGLISGALVRKHLDAVLQNTKDLISECERAQQAGIPVEEIRSSILSGFYTTNSPDPLLNAVLQRSFEAIWKQVQSV